MATASCLADAMFDADGIDLISREGDSDHLALAMDVHVQEGLTVCRPGDAPWQLGQSAEHAGAARVRHVDMALKAKMVVVGLTDSKEVWPAFGLPIGDQPLQVARVVPVIVLPEDHEFIAGLGGLLYSSTVALGDVFGLTLWGIVHPDDALGLQGLTGYLFSTALQELGTVPSSGDDEAEIGHVVSILMRKGA